MAHLETSTHSPSTTNADVYPMSSPLTDLLDPRKRQDRPPVLAGRSPLCSSWVRTAWLV